MGGRREEPGGQRARPAHCGPAFSSPSSRSASPRRNPLFLGRGSRRGVPGAEAFGGSTPFLSRFSFLSLAPPRGQPQLLGCISTAVMVVEGHGDLKCKRKPSSRDSGTEELRKGPRGQRSVSESVFCLFFSSSLLLCPAGIRQHGRIKLTETLNFQPEGQQRRPLGAKSVPGCGESL